MIDTVRFIREVLGGNPPSISIAIVELVTVLADRSAVVLDVKVQPLLWQATVRLMTPYLGQGYGHIALPVPGDEVLVFFADGNPNTGVAQWGTFNGRNKVPVGAVEKLILFEGRDGDNLRVHIRGGASIEIDLDQDLTIHGNEVRTVDGSRSVTIKKDETEKIGGNRTLTVGGNEFRAIEGNSTEAIVGNRTEVIGGDATRTVMGAESESCLGRLTVIGVPATIPAAVPGAWIIAVEGAVIVNAGGAAAINCVGALSVTVDAIPVMTATSALVSFLVPTTGDQT